VSLKWLVSKEQQEQQEEQQQDAENAFVDTPFLADKNIYRRKVVTIRCSFSLLVALIG
jgi:hypothetical protein